MPVEIIVCVKQVLDPRLELNVGDRHEPSIALHSREQPVYVLNPADRHALEEAMRLAETLVGHVSIVTVGPPRARQALRYCLARGADRALHLVDNRGARLDSRSTGLILARALRQMPFDLILCGEQSADHQASEVPPILAEFLDIPQVTRAVQLGFERRPGSNQLVGHRLLEQGDRQIVACPLPAVVSVSPHMNQPRYVSVHAQLKIIEDCITEVSISELLDDDMWAAHTAPAIHIRQMAPPRLRPKRVFTPGSDLSAMDRIRLMSGGSIQRDSTRVQDTAEQAADEIIKFLQYHQLI